MMEHDPAVSGRQNLALIRGGGRISIHPPPLPPPCHLLRGGMIGPLCKGPTVRLGLPALPTRLPNWQYEFICDGQEPRIFLLAHGRRSRLGDDDLIQFFYPCLHSLLWYMHRYCLLWTIKYNYLRHIDGYRPSPFPSPNIVCCDRLSSIPLP